MNRHLVFKMSCFRVAELRNSPAITRIPRLEPEHFNRQSVRPRLNQRFPGLFDLSLNVLVFAKSGYVLITEVLTNVTFQIERFINSIIKL